MSDKPPLIIGCEPLNANDAYLSKKEGKLIPQLNPNTIADGLRTSLGSYTFPIVLNLVFDIICVNETQIIESMKNVYQRLKIVIEPSAALGPAVLISNDFQNIIKKHKFQNIGVILCGGNVDLSVISQLFQK